MKVTASAPAKVILLGEHFVVYGKPAIVVAIDKRAYVTAELRTERSVYIKSNDLRISGCFHEGGKFQAEEGGPEAQTKLKPVETIARRLIDLSGGKMGVSLDITSEIPVEAGLGSSAAVSVASASALSQLLDLSLSKDDIFNLAYDAERLIHGTPSGIDPAISTYGGIVQYIRDKGVTHLSANVYLQFVIGNTGMTRSTGRLVASVRELREKYPSIVAPILEAAERTVFEAIRALESGDLRTLGNLMDVDHGLLSAVGVSNDALERLIYAARRAGAYGAKLTGAGGGGCMIALTPPDKIEDIVRAIRDVGGSAFTSRKVNEGVRIEE